jgi:hypothetical protein
MFRWDVNEDRTWAVVYDRDDQIVAQFRDDDAASEYVTWRNHRLT